MKLGEKYYRYNDQDELETIRIDKSNIDIELDKDFILLNPHGYIAFSIVNSSGTKDVIVTLHRSKFEIKNDDQWPYAVCRQNIFDVFANQIVKDDTIYIGVSISKDTCPADTPFQITIACDGIIDMDMIAVYMDDSLNTILSFIDQSKYDSVLLEMYNTVTNVKFKGYYTTIKDLLYYNYFMYDFRKGFDIIDVQFIILVDEYDLLVQPQINYFEDILKHHMFDVFAIPFSMDIDISSIERDFIYVADIDDNLYLIVYTEGGYCNRKYEEFSDKRDRLALIKYQKSNY